MLGFMGAISVGVAGVIGYYKIKNNEAANNITKGFKELGRQFASDCTKTAKNTGKKTKDIAEKIASRRKEKKQPSSRNN